MKLLILGGTVFVGRHFVQLALERGHEVTLLHRGKRGAELFPDVEKILADRDGGLDALGDRTWDAVLDCCGYVPRVVRQSAQALKGRVGRYVFVSSVSVYPLPMAPNAGEDSPRAILADPTVEEVTGESYGGLKALCEDEVMEAFGDRAVIVRPGLITGPYDPSNRFTHWAERIGTSSPVLAPALREQALQLIDARDLGAWMLGAIENGLSGAYNLAGPETAKTFGGMLDACQAQNPSAEFVWVQEAQLEGLGLSLWKDLPLTVGSDAGEQGIMRVDNSKALRTGLQCRPWTETAADVLAWVQGPEPKPEPTHGLTRLKELEIIEKLRSGS